MPALTPKARGPSALLVGGLSVLLLAAAILTALGGVACEYDCSWSPLPTILAALSVGTALGAGLLLAGRRRP